MQNVISVMNVAADLTLIAVYAAALWRMWKGTKYKLFIVIITLLLFASIDDILLTVTNQQILKHSAAPGDEHMEMWLVVNSFSYFAYQASFDIAQWLMAYEYFSIALAMPLALKGIQQDPGKRL